jgi:hypothetical protein
MLLIFPLGLVCEWRFLPFVLFISFGLSAGFLLSVGSDLLTLRSNIDALILPYRVLWVNVDSRAAEVEKDFHCCGFDASLSSPVYWLCSAPAPFCRTEIAAEFDRDEKGLAIAALVAGGINACVAIVSLIAGIRESSRSGARVVGQAPQAEEETGAATAGDPAPYPGAQAPSPLCQQADDMPPLGEPSPLCEDSVSSPYREAQSLLDQSDHQSAVSTP